MNTNELRLKIIEKGLSLEEVEYQLSLQSGELSKEEISDDIKEMVVSVFLSDDIVKEVVSESKRGRKKKVDIVKEFVSDGVSDGEKNKKNLKN